MTVPLSPDRLAKIRADIALATQGLPRRERFEAWTRAADSHAETLLDEVDRLRAESEERLGELLFWHFEYREAMDNYRGENWQVGQLRTELADTAMMRDFNQRSVGHIATKRDLAEAAVVAWDRGEISGDAAVLIIRKALADGPVAAAEDGAQ